MSKKNKNQEEQELDVVDYMERFADWAEKNAKFLVVGFLAFTFVVAGAWVFSAMKTKALNQVANEAGVINRKIDLLETALDKAKDKESEAFKNSKDQEITKIGDSVDKLMSENPSKAVTDFTTVRWAAFLVEQGQKDLAFKYLEKAKPAGERELSATILFLKSSLLAEKGKTDEAVANYEKIISSSGWSIFHGEAMIQKASILQSKGKTDEAIDLLSKAKDMNKDSGVSKDAAKYMRLLKLKKSHPNLSSVEG